MEMSDFQKIFAPTPSVLSHSGESAITAFTDKSGRRTVDSDREPHLVVILEESLEMLHKISSRTKGREAMKASEALDFVWGTIRAKGAEYKLDKPLNLGDNLYLMVSDQNDLEGVLKAHSIPKERFRVECHSSFEAITYTSEGFQAEITVFDRIRPKDRLRGIVTIEDDSVYAGLCETFGTPQGRIQGKLDLNDISGWLTNPLPNQYVIFNAEGSDSEPFLAVTSGEMDRNENGEWVMDSADMWLKMLPAQNLKKQGAIGVSPRDIEQVCYLHALRQPHITRVIVTGEAGSGKTIVGYASLLEQTLRRAQGGSRLNTGTPKDTTKSKFVSSRFDRLYLVKASDTIGGRDIGFRPGDVHEKLSDFIRSYEDSHEWLDLNGRGAFWNLVKGLKEGDDSHDQYLVCSNPALYAPTSGGIVMVEDWGTYRGRSLNRSAMFIDEAQNLREDEISHLNTRVCPGSLIVISGDYDAQIDNPRTSITENGLFYSLETFLGRDYAAVIALPNSYRDRAARDMARATRPL